MNVLISCEESGAVRDEFLALGHNAWSCDLQPTSSNIKDNHYTGDVRKILERVPHTRNVKWDLMIAFPPCTDLAVSGARWFKEKQADGRQQRSIDFFLLHTQTDIPYWCIENPIGIMSTHYRKPDQIVQPWQFGHGETKATCLWLHGLPPLQPTRVVSGRKQRIWYMSPGPERGKLRSKTYSGIARAMAQQWASYVDLELRSA
jgi:site-specific DNA-cytosine methylase